MPKSLPDHFTYSHVVADDGTRSFACPTDSKVWPWLTLDPRDPIVVQTLNYYASYEVLISRGRHRPGQWTALTQTGWRCGQARTGHAARGVYYAAAGDDAAGYRMEFFDRDDAMVYEMHGEGVVFKNRNFEAWRKEQKQELGEVREERDFPYAPAASVGMASPIESFVSIPAEESGRPARGLITRDNGFPPAHRYHDGSGDHVNASHLADAGRQYLRLVLESPKLLITGGEMQFRRYVELGYPFDITTVDEKRGPHSLTLQIRQGDNLCATILLQYALS